MSGLHSLPLLLLVTIAYFCDSTSALRGTADKVVAAKANEFPFVVSIGDPAYPFNQGSDENHFCTGALISKKHILTAAHCTLDEDGNPMNPNGMVVTLGSHDLHHGQHYKVKKFLTYVEWKESIDKKKLSRPNDYDAAVLQLEKEVSNVTPGVLSQKSDSSFDKHSATVIGWESRPDGSFTRYLHKGTATMHKHGDCITKIREMEEEKRKASRLPRFFLPLHNICSNNSQPSVSYTIIQGGDSGGPLLDENKQIIGITLSVAPLGDEWDNNPLGQTVHGKINFYRDFINAAMTKLK